MAYGFGCVRGVLPAYGADQIWPPNLPQISVFFALFYAQEHLTIILSSILLPFIHQNSIIWPLPLNKPHFGILLISAFILILAISILVTLSRYFRQTLPQDQNVFSRSWRTIGHAIHNKKRFEQKKLVSAKLHSSPPPKNLLDHFLDDHNCERDKECDFGRRQICGQAKFIGDLKSTLRIYFLLSPLPLFWAIHAQLASIFQVQARSLDSRLPFFHRPLFPPSILPLRILPNLLVLLLIPFFYLFLFRSPSLSQCFSLNTYLRRMGIGLFLFAFASFFSASIQMLLNISPSSSIQSTSNSALFKIFNTFPADCTVSISRISSNVASAIQVEANNNSLPIPILPTEIVSGFADFQFRFTGSSCAGHRKNRVRIRTKPGKLNVAVVGPQGILWTAFSPPNSFQSTIGVLVLLPCNYLDSLRPLECANSSGDSLAQALTPFSSSLSLCQSNDALENSTSDSINDTTTSIDSSPPSFSQSTSPADCSAIWTPNEAIPSQLFVFPPRGDNLGMGRGSLYEPKALSPGSYILTLNPSSSAPTFNSSNDNSSVADSSSSFPPPSVDSNGFSSSLQQPIIVDDSGSISLLLLSLDGSPLAGQNDSSPRPNPTVLLLLIAPPPSLNILWIFPQNLLLAAGEVLLCIPALEFCYVQAPNALKTTVIGFWYLLIYFGLVLSPQLAKLQPFMDLCYQLLFTSFSFFCIGLMFTLIAHFFFKYRDNLTGNVSHRTSIASGETDGLAEKLEGTLRTSIARLPTRKVIRL